MIALAMQAIGDHIHFGLLMYAALLLTISASAQLATLSSRADEVHIGGCSGIVDRCPGKQDFRYQCKKSPLVNLSCRTSVAAVHVRWYIDGFSIDTTTAKRCEVGTSRFNYPPGSHPPISYDYCLANSSSIAVRIESHDCAGAIVFSCTAAVDNAGRQLVRNYSVCLYDENPRFLSLQPSTNLLATETFYTKTGDVIEMNCTYNFLEAQTAYIYNLTWTRNETGDIQVISTEISNSISCYDIGGNTFTSRLLVTAGDTDAKYSCIIAKNDFARPWMRSELVKQYLLISLQPRQILTYPQIAGVSASVFVVLVVIAYMVWRFLTPLQSQLHHTCNYGRRAKAGSKFHDAVVFFNDSCSETSSFAYNGLIQKVEGEWCYRLCLPQRDFLPGEDMATQVIDMVDHSLMCIFLMDDGFFDCRWCDCALQNALKFPGKAICILFLSPAVVRLWKTRLDRIAKVGTIINWKANETANKSTLKRIFTRCDNWSFLKKNLPPNQHLSCCKCTHDSL